MLWQDNSTVRFIKMAKAARTAAIAANILITSLIAAPLAQSRDFGGLANEIQNRIVSVSNSVDLGIASHDSNAPTPEFREIIEKSRDFLENDPALKAKLKEDIVLQALFNQTLNHVKHVSFDFRFRDAGFPHGALLKGPYPFRPTRLALQKVEEFLRIASPRKQTLTAAIPKNEALELRLLAEQTAWTRKLTDHPWESYEDMRARLNKSGENASFPEFRPIIDYLVLHLKSDERILKLIHENTSFATFREMILQRLSTVRNTMPYQASLEVIQRTVEFIDIARRAEDPEAPPIYHSSRYEYYTHFLEGGWSEYIALPTLTSLGASDILKVRGVPFGFLGVQTETTRVDGRNQTPYEFYVHDIFHTARMYLYLKEAAMARGMTIDAYAKASDEFVRNKLGPLFLFESEDDERMKNRKRIIKMILFEVLHEDALDASMETIQSALLKPPLELTPTELIVDDRHIVYVMDPGAASLAYVFRKLSHLFYDAPENRLAYIVDPRFRTKQNVFEAAQALFAGLGLPPANVSLAVNVASDLGFPSKFRATLMRDITSRPGQTVILNERALNETADHCELLLLGPNLQNFR